MNQLVVAIDGKHGRKPARKVVPSNQKAIDALPLNSGMWRVRGIPGLYVRCRSASRSFILQRRVRGELVKETITGTLKEARKEAERRWTALEPKPAGHRKTFGQAFDEFMADGGKRGFLAEKTRQLYKYNLDHYLEDWKDRALEDISADAECGRRLYRYVRNKHGNATGYQVIRLVSAIFEHQRKVNRKLQSPADAVTLVPIRARNWAFSPDELKKWWRAAKTGDDGKEIVRGVSTLAPVKRAWWLTALFTGARKGSVEALEWRDVDPDQKVIQFRVAKGDRPYVVPMSDKLAEILTAYRDSGSVPPSNWLFPSPRGDGHIVGVRDDKKGVPPAHKLRHTFRTVLTELGYNEDQARLLMGHSMTGTVSRNYITAPLLVESLRPIANAVSKRYEEILGPMLSSSGAA